MREDISIIGSKINVYRNNIALYLPSTYMWLYLAHRENHNFSKIDETTVLSNGGQN